MARHVIDAAGLHYKLLNEKVRQAAREGITDFELTNVRGQRYIAGSLAGEIEMLIRGVPGQDLAMFLSGPRIRVEGNGQDGVGNTMDDGLVSIHGMAGDVLGYAMRGGRIWVEGDVGYRVGIHMKAFQDKKPVIVVGGKAGDFLGEYMAGGAIILLGVNTAKPDAPITGRSLGTGMHGGVIYVRGQVPAYQLGPGLTAEPLEPEDTEFLATQIKDYAREFGLDADMILAHEFVRIRPFSHRPYGNMYVGAV